MRMYYQNAICYGKDYSISEFKYNFRNVDSMIEIKDWKNGYALHKEVKQVLINAGQYDPGYLNDINKIVDMMELTCDNWYIFEFTLNTFEDELKIRTEKFLPIINEDLNQN